MARYLKAYTFSSDGQRPIWPFLISLAGHMILLGMILINFQCSQRSDMMFAPSVINVEMVELGGGGETTAKKLPTAEKAPVVEETPAKAAKTAPAEKAPTPSEVKPEISIADSKPAPSFKPKTALKYKTFKTDEVLKNAVEKIEAQVDKVPPKPLEDTIKELREKVEKAEEGPAGKLTNADAGAANKAGTFAHGSKQEVDLIDLYRGEIAYRINENWAFSEQLADRNQKLMASLVFKVMPDGSIEDIFFVDRSGNQYLDDSAYKAIVKSSPVMPHPKELNRPYVELGLRFTPEGVY